MPNTTKANVTSEEEETNQRLLKMILRGCDIFEVFSPERAGKACARYQLTPGPALASRTSYNLTTEKDKQRALKLYTEMQPELVMLSPPFTALSCLQTLYRHAHGVTY